MKRWALIVAILYGLMLGVLSLPLGLLAFMEPAGTSAAVATSGKWQFWRVSQIWDGLLFNQTAGISVQWQWWLWLAVMGLAQAALLAVPVSLAGRRPVTRRPLAQTILAGALMMSLLVIGAFTSLYEFVFRDKQPWDPSARTALVLGVAVWCAWALIFFRLARATGPEDLVTRLCNYMLKGSILELLIAVPTHIVARCRDYCCAGIGTFIGLTLGMSVMLFSFGPGVFFLFAARWRRLHPCRDADRSGPALPEL